MSESVSRRKFLARGTAGRLAATTCAVGAVSPAKETSSKPVRIGVVGTGGRGRWHIKNMLSYQEAVEVPAVCDIKPAALNAAVSTVKGICGKEPATYGKNEHDYRNMFQRDDLDGILVATDTQWLGKISIDAMKAGKHVGHEVSGCYTIEECWGIVEEHKRTGKQCMLLENCCYGQVNLMILNMVRQGLFGEPYFATGSYLHDARHYLFDGSGKLTWRGELLRDSYGNSYNSHALGSPSKWLGINDGDRFESCTCTASRPKETHAYVVAKYGDDSPKAKIDFKLGDFITTVIHTAKGKQIRVDYSLTNTRPYSRYYLLQGMKGCFDSRKGMWVGKEPTGGRPPWDPVAKFQEKYAHPFWKKDGATALKAGGHGGKDYFVIRDFLKMVRTGKPPWIDVYDAASWSSILHYSQVSLDRKSGSIEMPDFTDGKWKDPNWRKGRMV